MDIEFLVVWTINGVPFTEWVRTADHPDDALLRARVKWVMAQLMQNRAFELRRQGRRAEGMAMTHLYRVAPAGNPLLSQYEELTKAGAKHLVADLCDRKRKKGLPLHSDIDRRYRCRLHERPIGQWKAVESLNLKPETSDVQATPRRRFG